MDCVEGSKLAVCQDFFLKKVLNLASERRSESRGASGSKIMVVDDHHLLPPPDLEDPVGREGPEYSLPVWQDERTIFGRLDLPCYLLDPTVRLKKNHSGRAVLLVILITFLWGPVDFYLPVHACFR